MYTVMRYSTAGTSTCVDEVGAMLLQHAIAQYQGPDKGVDNRISLTVAMDGTWSEQIATIEAFITRTSPVIEWAKRQGVGLSLDIAVEPEDIGAFFSTLSLPVEFLKRICIIGIAIDITIYR